MVKKNKLYEGLKQGLEEAIADASGKPRRGTKSVLIKISDIPEYRSKDIKMLRKKLNLTQAVFAKVMGVHIKTVEAWESGLNVPSGTAQRMLSLLEHDSDLLEKHNILVSV